MKRYIVNILIYTAFLFSISGIKGMFFQESLLQSSEIEQSTVNSLEKEQALATTHSFSFDFFCFKSSDVPLLISSSPRSINFPKNLKSVAVIQRLSAMDTPLVARDAKNLYFQYCFIKYSIQYFIYTLRRLLI